MGRYRDAVELSGTNSPPDIALVRHTASRAGIALNIEQELQKDLGIFLRISGNDGSKEAYEFTEINRSLAAGLSLKGERWNRHEDTFGLAMVNNYLSGAAQQYFRAGGVDILIGDGALRYGTEQIAETYYSVKIASGLTATMDYQHINHPAYNRDRDRGPVSTYALRLHAEF
jgi:high affinity Mn2+ porin